MSRRYSSGAGRVFAIILAMILGASIVLGFIFRKQLAVAWSDVKNYFKRVDDTVNNGDDNNNGNQTGDQNTDLGDQEGEPGDNMAVSEIDYSGITLAMVPMVASELSAQAESGLNITATVLPSQATDKALDWSVEFVDETSEWAQGKTVTDYVTVSGTDTGATVECLKGFGSQMLVKAVSRSNPDVYATCTLDYYARVIGAKVNFGDTFYSMTPGGEIGNALITDDICNSSISIDFEISDYTIPLSEESTVFNSYQITGEFYDYIKSSFNANSATGTGTLYFITPREDLSEINLKYFGLKWQWEENKTVQMSPTYALGGFDKRIETHGAEYLALANSFNGPAVIFSASYQDAMNDVSFYFSLSYQEGYFAIDVENLEFDQTGAVM